MNSNNNGIKKFGKNIIITINWNHGAGAHCKDLPSQWFGQSAGTPDKAVPRLAWVARMTVDRGAIAHDVPVSESFIEKMVGIARHGGRWFRWNSFGSAEFVSAQSPAL